MLEVLSNAKVHEKKGCEALLALSQDEKQPKQTSAQDGNIKPTAKDEKKQRKQRTARDEKPEQRLVQDVKNIPKLPAQDARAVIKFACGGLLESDGNCPTIRAPAEVPRT